MTTVAPRSSEVATRGERPGGGEHGDHRGCLWVARLHEQVPFRSEPDCRQVGEASHDVEAVTPAVECTAGLVVAGLRGHQPEGVGGDVRRARDQHVHPASERGRQRRVEIARVDGPADRLDVAAGAPDSHRVDVSRMQLHRAHGSRDGDPDGPRAAAQVEHDSTRLDQRRGLADQQLGAAAGHEDTWLERDALPAELRPTDDLLERDSGDPSRDHVLEEVGRGGLGDQQRGLLLREDASGRAQRGHQCGVLDGDGGRSGAVGGVFHGTATLPAYVVSGGPLRPAQGPSQGGTSRFPDVRHGVARRGYSHDPS